MSCSAAAQAQQAPQDVLAGIVERVTFHNAENARRSTIAVTLDHINGSPAMKPITC
jgi:hypothetical protein